MEGSEYAKKDGKIWWEASVHLKSRDKREVHGREVSKGKLREKEGN